MATARTSGTEHDGVRNLETELIPGTEIMVDHDDVNFVHAHNSSSSTVLIPQPTNDRHDPLNWSAKWKTAVMVTQGFFVISSIVPGLSIAPMTPLFMELWNKSLSQIALLTGVTVILMGYANFVIIPCAEIFGRRNTLLVCALLTIASTIWSAAATSYGSFLGSRILCGTGAAANESIMTVVVADIYFLHERGKFVGSYFWCYFLGLFLGPVISGSVAQRVSYKWFFWACTIAQGISFISLWFLAPETRRLNTIPIVREAIHATSTHNIEKGDEVRIEDGSTSSEAHHVHVVDEYLGKGAPSLAQFKLMQPIDRVALRGVLRHFFVPVRIFFFPIVFWASMTVGAAANALLGVNILSSQALAAPPYNFNAEQVGWSNFALVGGGIIGLAVAGPWCDWLSIRATKKNNGIREPEMRLMSLLPFVAAALVGLVVFGVGVQKQWPWPAVVVVGFGFVGLQVVALPTIVVTYAIDCYKPATGEIMVIATVVKNTFGFGMTYYMNDWAAKDGFIPPNMMMMAMTVGITLIGMLVFIPYGKTFRRWTKNSSVHTM